MPFTVRDLVGDQQLTTVALDASLHNALNLMVEHGYSQLPVIESDGRLVGLVTSESVLRALDNFSATTASIRLAAAVVRIADIDRETYRLHDDLFRLLDRLKTTDAVIIVDDRRYPIGIVTNADMAEWLRRRAQDNLFVADIEQRVKDYIRLAFRDAAGHPDRAALDAAAAAAASRTARDTRDNLRKALRQYLSRHAGSPPAIDEELLDDVITRSSASKARITTFDELSFSDYAALFLAEDRWPHYAESIPLEREMLHLLLDDVRRTRNDLAHLRSGISSRQRDQLRACYDLLERAAPALRATFPIPTDQIAVPTTPTLDQATKPGTGVSEPHNPQQSSSGQMPISQEPSINYWVFPAGGRPNATVIESLHEWLDLGFWGMNESTAHRRNLRVGDRACFYAARGTRGSGSGVVAVADITGRADQLIPAAELPSSASSDSLYRVPLANVVWLSHPIPIDASLRARLDAFRDRRLDTPWAWFIQSTNRLSAHDFAVLTGDIPVEDQPDLDYSE